MRKEECGKGNEEVGIGNAERGERYGIIDTLFSL